MRLANLKSRSRDGFTLIELLIVISILALIAAITASAVFRVNSTQAIKRTETSVQKIAGGLSQQWQAVIDDVEDDYKNARIPAVVFTAANNDRDLAKAIWLKLKLRHEFPQTVTEATSDVKFNNVVVLPKKQAYIALLAGIVTTSLDQESSACLYAALSQTRRGQIFNPDSVGPEIVQSAGKANLFVDGWGKPQPICFQRWPTSLTPAAQAELNQVPGDYAKPSTANSVKSIDPGDPFGKLQTWNNTALLDNALGKPGIGQNNNFTPYVWAYGADRSPNTSDDILSFRMLRQGQRGN